MPTYTPPRYPNLAAAIAIDGRPKYLIAAAAGFAPNSVSGIQSGRIDPTPELRRHLAEVLGGSVDDLFAEQVAS
jgi:hypothetical protein